MNEKKFDSGVNERKKTTIKKNMKDFYRMNNMEECRDV